MTDSSAFPNSIACQHGSLRRSCEICELANEVKALTAERNELRAQVASLQTGDNLRAIVSEDTNVLMEEIAHDKAQIRKLIADRDAWRKLVVEHNAACTQLCRSGNVECRVTDSYSGCVTCPELYQIDIPPELEQP